MHVGFRDDIIQAYWEHCNQLRTKGKEPPKCLLICDDIMVTRSNKKYGVTRTSDNYWLNRVYAEGRHQNISVVLSVQSLSVGLPFVRCADVFMCFPSAIHAYQDIKMITENYVPMGNRRAAEALLDHFTQYQALVVEYWRQSSRRWQTRIKWYTIPQNFATCNVNLDELGVSTVREGDQGGNEQSGDPSETCEHVHSEIHKGQHQERDPVPEVARQNRATGVHGSGQQGHMVPKTEQTILEGR